MYLRLNKILVALALCAAHAAAQVSSATLLGTVKDATGSSVPAATVTVKNVDTALERTTSTDGAGNYTVPNLQPGRYQVAVTAPGFKTATIPDIELQVAQKATANVVLEVGQVTENINVSAEIPMMFIGRNGRASCLAWKF